MKSSQRKAGVDEFKHHQVIHHYETTVYLNYRQQVNNQRTKERENMPRYVLPIHPLLAGKFEDPCKRSFEEHLLFRILWVDALIRIAFPIGRPQA